TRLEEARKKRPQMSFDLRHRVLMTLVGGNLRPRPQPPIVPRRPCQERDLRRRITKPQRVVERKIMQLVGTEDRFGVLLRLTAARARRYQFGADLRAQNIEQRRTRLLSEPMRLGDPANDVLDERLGHARI